MKLHDLIATAQTTINAPVDSVWDALINPAIIKKYMFGTTVISGWKEGSPVTWKGEWKGKAYEDKGVILQLKSKRKLQYSHFSPLTGEADIPENYHIVTIGLEEKNKQTIVSLSQNNNATAEAKQHSEQNWKMVLMQLKKVVEENN